MINSDFIGDFLFDDQHAVHLDFDLELDPFPEVPFDEPLSETEEVISNFTFELSNEVPNSAAVQSSNNQILQQLIINDQNNQVRGEVSVFSNQRSASGSSTRSSKRKVDLSEKAEIFKCAFYQVFTDKKKFPKTFVKKIHDLICQIISLPKMKREQVRSIDLYFEDFASQSERILAFLHLNKSFILESIPELIDLK